RAVDTAAVYRNEDAIGRVLQRILDDPASCNGLKRSDIFITTKLGKCHLARYRRAFETSRRKLNLDYIDLYLIHWPGTQKLPGDDPRNAENRAGSYRAMEELYRQGKVRAIGVSNYTVRHLEPLLATATVKPSVLQTELHPLWPDKELVTFCRQHHIQLEAYSSLGEGALVDGRQPLPAVEQAVREADHPLTTAQVLLRWAVQHGFAVIPKSTTPKRIAENI
ncbi:NADP-dependent oxidoreductase domain-containing protein, partial [Syncephalis pseudoplumigaleata]